MREKSDVSSSGSQKLSGIAVIDGKNKRKPDKPKNKPKKVVFKLVTQAKANLDHLFDIEDPGKESDTEKL